MCASTDSAAIEDLVRRLQPVPISARRLFCVILRQRAHGPFRFKAPGVATMPEILEACGVDVDQCYALLEPLGRANLIEIAGEYPFEEVRLTSVAVIAASVAERCEELGVPLDEVLVELQCGRVTL